MLRAKNISFCFVNVSVNWFEIRILCCEIAFPVDASSTLGRGNDLIEGFVAMNIYSWASLTSQRFCHFLSSIESRRESEEKDKFLERILLTEKRLIYSQIRYAREEIWFLKNVNIWNSCDSRWSKFSFDLKLKTLSAHFFIEQRMCKWFDENLSRIFQKHRAH